MRRMFNHGSIAMVASAIGLLITLLISVLIFYSIQASTPNPVAHPATGSSTYLWGLHNASVNATSHVGNQAGTFFTIAPIIAIVIVAVVVIGYVQRIGG